MRAVVQRVTSASVAVDERVISSIGLGLLVLLAVKKDDIEADALKLAGRVANLRIFSDDQGKMNLSLKEQDGEMLVVSQFTLYADTAKGRRPSFVQAAAPQVAEPLIRVFSQEISRMGIAVKTGQFRAHMAVDSVNDGPVTVIVEAERSVAAG